MPDRTAITGIDHVLVGVRDLEAARLRWQALGFTVTPRGRHIGWGTANYCIMFERGYVELIGIVDPTQFTNNLDAFLAEREGLMGVAFGSADSTRTHAALAGAGLHPDGPKQLKRLLELPEGDVTPAFRLVFLPRAETPGISAFFCQHLTPELLRRPEWLRHANGATALAAVTVVVDNAAGLARGWAPVFGDGAVGRAGDTWFVETGDGEVQFVTPAALRAAYPDVAVPLLAAPALAAVSIEGALDRSTTVLANGAIVALAPSSTVS